MGRHANKTNQSINLFFSVFTKSSIKLVSFCFSSLNLPVFFLFFVLFLFILLEVVKSICNMAYSWSVSQANHLVNYLINSITSHYDNWDVNLTTGFYFSSYIFYYSFVSFSHEQRILIDLG